MVDRSQFNAEDFLIDSTFQQYCAGTDSLCIEYWEKYVAAHPEQQQVIGEAKKMFLILSGHKRPLDQQVLNMKKISAQQTEKLNIRPNYNWLKIAAALLILTTAAFLFRGYYSEKNNNQSFKAQVFKTKSGERKKITLPDGSVVLLNAQSTLSIGKEFNDNLREVSLQGEAYFDVVHNKNKPFKVHTGEFNINVLGTAFNVKAYPDETSSEATLIRGLITMESVNGNGGIITLKPSQKVTFLKEVPAEKTKSVLKPVATRPEIIINHYTKIKDSTIVETAWTQNKIEIYDLDFDEIKNVLEKWFNVDIRFEDPEVQKYRFTATFSHENIAQVLEALKKVENNFNYEIKGNQVIISK